jgi:hypothetical protein
MMDSHELCETCGLVTPEDCECACSQIDELINELEEMGLGWSLDHTGNLIEARVWDWPAVIGRYRPIKVEPIAEMLLAAMKDAGIKSAMEEKK